MSTSTFVINAPQCMCGAPSDQPCQCNKRNKPTHNALGQPVWNFEQPDPKEHTIPTKNAGTRGPAPLGIPAWEF